MLINSNIHLGSKRHPEDAELNDFSPPPKRICVEDAVQYIEQVKRTFIGSKENIYNEFLRLISMFRDGK